MYSEYYSGLLSMFLINGSPKFPSGASENKDTFSFEFTDALNFIHMASMYQD